MYLPPYSPGRNPIDLLFAKRNALLRQAAKPSMTALWSQTGELLDRFSADKCRHCLVHAGYVREENASNRAGLRHAEHVPRFSRCRSRGAAALVELAEDYRERLDHALQNGWTIGQRGESLRGPFVYFLNEGHPGIVIEMAELTPTRRRIFEAVREAAIGWDGRDPIRRDWPNV